MSGFYSAGLFDVIPDSVLENFERDDPLDDWEDPENEAGNYSITTSNVLEGDRSLEGSDSNFLIQTDNPFEDLPEQGDDFACLVRPQDGNADASLNFGATDSDNLYAAQIRLGNGSFRMFRLVDGSFAELASTSISGVSSGDALDIRVEWQTDDTIQATLYEWDEGNFERAGEVASVSDTDGVFGSGGIGVRALNEQTIFDLIRYEDAN